MDKFWIRSWVEERNT